MKKIIFSLILLTAIKTTFAQSKAEQMFQATVSEFQANPAKAIRERASDDYVLISSSGYMIDKAKTEAIFKNVSSVSVSFTNLKVRQTGLIIIVTGKEHAVRHHSDGTPDLAIDYLSTYVYEIKGDHLIYLSGHHTKPAP